MNIRKTNRGYTNNIRKEDTMKLKKLWSILLCITMTAGLMMGCGGSKETEDADGTDTEYVAAEGESDSIVRYTLTSVPVIDPGVGSDMGAATVFVNVYDPLVMPDADGNIVPWIATEWEPSEDGLSWTFKLRNDVTFHSGNPLTANDVVYTMNRLTTMGQGFGYLFSDVTSVEAIDDYTVKFNCAKPNGTLPSKMVRLYILDSKLVQENTAESGDYGENGDYGTDYLVTTDAGSGPYKIKDFVANNYILGEKYADYWAGFEENTPEQFKLIGSNEAVTVKAMMSRHELEIADKYQSAETINELDEMEGIDVMNTNSGAEMYLLVNNAKVPTDDVHIRKAIAYIMDYDSIVENIFPYSTIPDSIISSTLFGYKKMNDYSYNLDKAKEEIEASAYAENIGDYEIEVCWVSETADREKLAMMVQAAGESLGLNIKVTETPWTSVVENSATIDGTASLTTTLWSANYPEAGAVMEASLKGVEDGSGTWQNCCWINDDKLDSMITDALQTVDAAEREAKYGEIQDYLADQCVMIPLCEQTERVAYQSSYMDFNSAKEDQLLPVMGYLYYMRNILVYPDKK